MGSAKILAALVARPASLTPSAPVTGDKLTTADVAGALAGIKKAHELLLRYKYLDDYSGEHEIISQLVEQLSFPSTKKISDKVIYKLIQVSLVDYAKPCLCPMCKGRGEVVNRQGKIIQCPKCNGMRLKSRSKSALSRAIGIPRETFRRNWWEVYEKIADQLSIWESEALKKLKQNCN